MKISGTGLAMRGAKVILHDYFDGTQVLRWKNRKYTYTTLTKAQRKTAEADGKTINARVEEALAKRCTTNSKGRKPAAGVEILANTLPVTGEPGMKVLLDRARRTTHKFKLDVAYGKEQNERNRQICGRWDDGSNPGTVKGWYRSVESDEVEAFKTKARELGIKLIDMETPITAMNRFR